MQKVISLFLLLLTFSKKSALGCQPFVVYYNYKLLQKVGNANEISYFCKKERDRKMILPIVAYGSPILRKIAEDITADYEALEKLLADMWETMYNSNGVGLAAPQINKAVRIFTMDSIQIFENDEDGDTDGYTDAPGFKGAFINPRIISLDGNLWSYNEGCLSIPKIREDIMRNESVTISYLDVNFLPHTKTFTGITARVILHEYDHLEGKLFIDYLKPLKKTLIKRKLDDISKGKIKVDYRMVFPK